MGTIKKSASYEISGAAERRSSALGELVENKRAAKIAAAEGKNPRAVLRRIPLLILYFSPDRPHKQTT